VANRVGPPWFRRMLASLGFFVPFGAMFFLPAGTPDVVNIGLWIAAFALPMYLFSYFGVKPMSV
jgi:hypothetical protein